MATVKLTINNQEIEIAEGSTILQAAQHLDIEIPVFCYHPRLAIAGNCRMCLVEVNKIPKPVASCAMPVFDGMIVRTDTPLVDQSRRGALEFLLINHPLDCPICDQGGECDLQDITMSYGASHSRFQEKKRTVPEKNLGPLIKTAMNRCIHCMRCVRFMNDVAGIAQLGAVGRGEDVEITSYLDQALTSEISGNLVDLCPVGALTSAPYAFKARSWELKKTESIDVMDGLGSHIRVDTDTLRVVRILPRLCDEINEEWISDKTRHACDGLAHQRLDRPYVRRNGRLQEASWAEAFEVIRQQISSLKGQEMAALAGDLADVESLFALKAFMTALDVPHRDCRQDGAFCLPAHRATYLFNSTLAGLEKADVVLIVDSALRQEAPLIATRLRKQYLQHPEFKAFYIGGSLPFGQEFTFPVEMIGSDPHLFEKLADGSHPAAQALQNAQYPMIIIGQSALCRPDSPSLFKMWLKIVERYGFIQPDVGWNGFNILQKTAARVGALDVGFVPSDSGYGTRDILKGCQDGPIKLVYLLGVDEIKGAAFGDAFVIYQGHHGDQGAHRADVILPGAAYTEKDATYVNTEGRVQRTVAALFPPGQAKEDWRIIRALSDVLGHPLPYDTLEALRHSLEIAHPVFRTRNVCAPAPWKDFSQEIVQEKREGSSSYPFFAPHDVNFYMTDPISRVSETMALCLRALNERAGQEKTGGPT